MYTIGQAAKATGKSRSTISAYIKKGAISAQKNANGSYSIDPAELQRVFPPGVSKNGSSEPKTNYAEVRLVIQNRLLHDEIERLYEQLTSKDSVIDDLRRRLAEAEEQRKLARLINWQQQQPEPEEQRKLAVLIDCQQLQPKPIPPWNSVSRLLQRVWMLLLRRRMSVLTNLD